MADRTTGRNAQVAYALGQVAAAWRTSSTPDLVRAEAVQAMVDFCVGKNTDVSTVMTSLLGDAEFVEELIDEAMETSRYMSPDERPEQAYQTVAARLMAMSERLEIAYADMED